MAEINSIEQTILKAEDYVAVLINETLRFSPITKKKLEEKLNILKENIKKKKEITVEDYQFLNNIIGESIKDNKTLVVLSDAILKNAAELLVEVNKNETREKLYDFVQEEKNKKRKKVMEKLYEDLLDREEMADIFASAYTEAFKEFEEKAIRENIDFQESVLNRQRLMEEFEKDITKNILSRVKNKEDEKLIVHFNKIKDKIHQKMLGDFEDYEKFISKYINVKNDKYNTEIMREALKKDFFKELTDKEMFDYTQYGVNATNFAEFFKLYVDPSTNEEKIYDEYLNIEKRMDKEVIERARKLEDIIEDLEALRNGETYWLKKNVTGEEIKVNAIEDLKEKLGVEDIDAFKIKNAVGNVKRTGVAKYLKDLDPYKIEKLQDVSKDWYYHNSVLGMLGYNREKINNMMESGEINEAFYRRATPLFSEKRQLMLCLSKAINPKHLYDKGSSITENCIKEFLQNIDKNIDATQRLLQAQGASMMLGISGIGIFILANQGYKHYYKLDTELKMLKVEKAFFDYRKIAESAETSYELQQLIKYAQLMSSPSETIVKDLGKNRQEINVLFNLMAKDLSDFYLNDMSSKREHIKNIKDVLKKAGKLAEFEKREEEISYGMLKDLFDIDEAEKLMAYSKMYREVKERSEKLQKEKEELLKQHLDIINEYGLQDPENVENTPKEQTNTLRDILKKIKNVNDELEETKKTLNKISQEFERINSPEEIRKLKQVENKLKTEYEELEQLKENLREKERTLSDNIKDAKELTDLRSAIKEKEKLIEQYSREIDEILKNNEIKFKEYKEWVINNKFVMGMQDLKYAAEVVGKYNPNYSLDGLNEVERNIKEHKIHLEILTRQEKALKEEMLKYLREGKIEEAKIYATRYFNTIGLMEKEIEKKVAFYEELNEKAEFENGMVKFVLDRDEKIVIPEKEWKEFEEEIEGLRDGRFLNYIEEANEEDFELLINHLKNDYENGFESEYKLRKNPFRDTFKVTIETEPEQTSLRVENQKAYENRKTIEAMFEKPKEEREVRVGYGRRFK